MSTENQFVWHDLHTTDKAASSAFYSTLFGWTIEGAPDTYLHLKNGENGFGGMEQARGASSHWLSYIGTSDATATHKKLLDLGATEVAPVMNIPNVGHIGVLADPSGATFALYQGTDAAHKDWAPRTDQVGDIGWQEVAVEAVDAGISFYNKGFGWTRGDSFGEGDQAYVFLMQGEKAVGGLLKRPPASPQCYWMFYVNVDDVDATAALAKENGGQVVHAATMTGVVQFAVIMDPQGAMFGIAKSLS